MAQIEWTFERKINRIDPINDQITKDYFDQIIAHCILIDRVIGTEKSAICPKPAELSDKFCQYFGRIGQEKSI